MRLAVLIPVYNAEKYLRECLDSAMAAGEAFVRCGEGRSFILCCRDDGSDDGSLEILRKYAQTFPNVRIASQANEGVSVTRNRLLDDMPDEVDFFAFLDSDDYIKSDMYAVLAEAQERTSADIAETEWDGPEMVIDDMSAYLLRRTAPGKHWINVINKLYRRTVVGAMRFREGLSFEEDFFFNYEVHQAIRRKVLVPGHYYTYRTNPDSATNALDMRRYLDSAAMRIRLSCEVFLAAGRIPKRLEKEWRRDLSRDAYRMLVRKNLKKNRDAGTRRELFHDVGRRLAELARDFGVGTDGLNQLQRVIVKCCVAGRYALARALVVWT